MAARCKEILENFCFRKVQQVIVIAELVSKFVSFNILVSRSRYLTEV